jgi:hypothetical protein
MYCNLKTHFSHIPLNNNMNIRLHTKYDQKSSPQRIFLRTFYIVFLKYFLTSVFYSLIFTILFYLMDQFVIRDEPEPQSQESLFVEEFASSLPVNVSEVDGTKGFTHSPNKRYIVWKTDQHETWNTFWADKLIGHTNRQHFECIHWGKPKKSQAWHGFYQAAELRTLLPKALCRVCWKAFAHPELRRGGSSTGTLARHTVKCKSRGSQQQLISVQGSFDVRYTYSLR